MAERRMFAKTIIESDAFNELSRDAQILYIHLGMNADDDGFLNNSLKIAAGLGMKKSVIDELIDARFLIRFPSGVIVIKHWKINNYIQKDRYKSTMYNEEKGQLEIKDNNSYTEKDKPCIHKAVYSLDTQVRLGKDSIGKDSIEESKDKSLLSCPVPATQDTGPAFISLPLNDKTEYEVPLSDVEEYKKLYPAVDVEQELRNMRGWCLDSPNKRKTRNGIKRFIGSWLKRQQDRSHDGYKSKGLEEFING